MSYAGSRRTAFARTSALRSNPTRRRAMMTTEPAFLIDVTTLKLSDGSEVYDLELLGDEGKLLATFSAVTASDAAALCDKILAALKEHTTCDAAWAGTVVQAQGKVT